MSVQQGPLDLGVLRNTVCVVTGAGNGGIGYGICEIAAGLGLHLAVVDLFEQVAQDAAAKLGEAFPTIDVKGYACDVTKPQHLGSVANSLQQDFPGRRLGAVFANAGVLFKPTSSILDLDLADVRKTMDVNVAGVVATMQTFIPILQSSSKPSVFCTTASVGGLVFGMGEFTDYCASKHAAVNLTESLASELAKKAPQIRVHVCCPCLVRTGLDSTSQSARADSPSDVTPVKLNENPVLDDLFMTPTNHGRQVWDRIAAGEFYMICDNIRPYVDHDFPFDGARQVQNRASYLLKPDFQRSFDATMNRHKPPLFREIGRRLRQSAKL